MGGASSHAGQYVTPPARHSQDAANSPRHFIPTFTPDELAAESWRPVPGFALEVSDLGRVRNTRTGKMARSFTVLGYQKVTTGNRNEYVHRLVLAVFVGPAPAGYVAAHGGTGNRSDNRLSNLRWASYRDNSADMIAQGTAYTALTPHLADLGRVSDAEIARRCGLGRSAVHNYRVRHGIARVSP